MLLSCEKRKADDGEANKDLKKVYCVFFFYLDFFIFPFILKIFAIITFQISFVMSEWVFFFFIFISCVHRLSNLFHILYFIENTSVHFLSLFSVFDFYASVNIFTALPSKSISHKTCSFACLLDHPFFSIAHKTFV